MVKPSAANMHDDSSFPKVQGFRVAVSDTVVDTSINANSGLRVGDRTMYCFRYLHNLHSVESQEMQL